MVLLPKIQLADLTHLLTIVMSYFNNISRKVELDIFGGDIINPDCPPEYQQEEIEKIENFKMRFQISSGITGMAIIEYIVRSKYSDTVYDKELKEFKKTILSNILKLRAKILNSLSADEFHRDTECSLINNPMAEEQFISFVTSKSEDIKNLINKKGDYRNIYYHFDMMALGQILPDREGKYYSPEIASLIENKILEIVRVVEL